MTGTLRYQQTYKKNNKVTRTFATVRYVRAFRSRHHSYAVGLEILIESSWRCSTHWMTEALSKTPEFDD
jgi:hypothetical protein